MRGYCNKNLSVYFRKTNLANGCSRVIPSLFKIFPCTLLAVDQVSSNYFLNAATVYPGVAIGIQDYENVRFSNCRMVFYDLALSSFNK